MANKTETRKFGFLDKIAYAAGDFGCNMSFALKGTMTIFWTQFMGIGLGTMATLTLLTQVWDAINDPLLGAMVDADKRKYSRNKFLAYIWFGSIGLIFAGALCFIPLPGLPGMAKNLLYIAGYVIWDAFYTIANVPYGSLLSLITTEAPERAQLSTFRSIGSIAGGMSAQAIIPMIVYDENSNLLGGRIWMIALVMGVVGFICFQFMIKNTVVRVNTDAKLSDDEPVSFNPFVGIGNFLRNRPAIGATIAPVGMFIGMYGAATASQVMFQAYFNAARYSGIFSMLSTIGMFVFVPFVTPIVKKFGKKEAITVGACVTVGAYVLMLLLPISPDMTGLIMFAGCQILAALGGGIGQCVSWSLMADAMDYEEWKYGTRNEGTTYAMHSFFRKLAQGIGPALGLVMAGWFGYDPALGAGQPADVAARMVKVVAMMYLFSGLLQLIGYGLVYNLDKKTLAKMEADLEKKHQSA